MNNNLLKYLNKMSNQIVPTSKRIYETKRTFIGTEEEANKYINVLERHYILDIFFEDYNKTYPIPTQSWEKIVQLMPLPMKYALKYVIFSVIRKNKNYIYVSENWGQLRKQTFEKNIKPSPRGITLSDNTSIFDKFNNL